MAIAIAASSPDFSPCGACSEVINEFSDDMVVVFEFKEETVVSQLKELLPFNFKL